MTFRSPNPKHGKFSEVYPGYEDCGWLNGGAKMCDHPKQEYDNSFYIMRGTDIIYICLTCKKYWHVDMSD